MLGYLGLSAWGAVTMPSHVLMSHSVKLKEKHNPLSSPLQHCVLFEMKRCWTSYPWYNSKIVLVPKQLPELLCCGGFTLTAHQAPTKSFCHSSAGQEQKIRVKQTLQVKIKAAY